MAIKKGLGKKNLDVLLSASSINLAEFKAPQENKGDSLLTLAVDKLQPGQYQPRKHIAQETLQELADSIKAQGIIQPIVVRPLATKKNAYEIIAGERRWRAAQLAGLTEVPAVVRAIPDQTALAMALIENIQREDLNPIEEAMSLQRLMDEFALTHQEVADTVGKSRTTVTNLIRLLVLNEEVKNLLAENKIEMGHAKVLLALQGVEQTQIARMVALKGLTVRETEVLVRQATQNSPAPQKSKTSKRDAYIRNLENNLAARLSASVKIKHQADGKGKLLIQYSSLNELEGILTQINMLEELA